MSSRRVGPPADAPGLTPAEERSLVHQLTHDVLADTAPQELLSLKLSLASILITPVTKLSRNPTRCWGPRST